jgi:carbon monoxide dehydrogenase subunit G
MAFQLPFKYRSSLTLPQNFNSVRSFLSAYPEHLPALFPGLQRFQELEAGVYSWEFSPLEYAGKSITINFSTSFLETSSELKVTPFGKEGNAKLSGSWKAHPEESSCKLILDFDLELTVPLPSLMRSMVAPIAERELKRLFDQYAKNIQSHFS